MGTKRKKATPGRAQFGQPRTIKDAALAVLEAAGKPLTISDIVAGIVEGKLYRFNTANPGTVVSHAVRRNCKGLDVPRHTGAEDFAIVDVNGKPHYTPAKGGE
tara:strand:- start:156 stop:464 length:309 start_codon:yes stop_codon:yes gene_type:complete